jgi:hypothetical protein
MSILTNKKDNKNSELSQKTPLSDYISEMADIWIQKNPDKIKELSLADITKYTQREVFIKEYTLSVQADLTLSFHVSKSLFIESDIYKLLNFDKIIFDTTILNSTTFTNIQSIIITDSNNITKNILIPPIALIISKQLQKLILEFDGTNFVYVPYINRPIGEFVLSTRREDFLGEYARVYTRQFNKTHFPVFAEYLGNLSEIPFYNPTIANNTLYFSISSNIEKSYPALKNINLGKFEDFSHQVPKHTLGTMEAMSGASINGGTTSPYVTNPMFPLPSYTNGKKILSQSGSGTSGYNVFYYMKTFLVTKGSEEPYPSQEGTYPSGGIDFPDPASPSRGGENRFSNTVDKYLYVKII